MAAAALLLAACSAEQAPETDMTTAQDGAPHSAPDATVEEPAGAERPPNIVLIIGDDHGYPYFGFNGDENVVTPHMDALAESGVVFSLAHATSNYCRPSLQTFITGLHPVQYDQRLAELEAERLAQDAAYQSAEPREQAARRQALNTSLMSEFETLPRLLGERGYVSFQGGKWWEQSYETGGFTHGMSEGWSWEEMADEGWFFRFMGGQGMGLGRTTMAPVTDFIEEHADQPFMIWYGPSLPHTPLNPPEEHFAHYAEADLSESAKLYYGNITWFDAGVGTLMAALEEAGVMDDTLIVYVNDNGWEQGPQDEYVGDRDLISNGGTRGKLSYFDNAFRTPIIFSWRGRIAPARDDEELISAIDIVPTVLDYVGLDASGDLPGLSLRPLMEEAEGFPSREVLVGRMTQHRADIDFLGEPLTGVTDLMGRNEEAFYVRDDRWHYVEILTTGEQALYDMIADPEARTNVVDGHRDLVPGFQAEIAAWRADFMPDE
jgi:uncharacterized sulfatase